MKRALIIAMVATFAGCDSPEASRTRGGGPGADTGNRGEVVLTHEGAMPYANTPDLIPAKGASVAPANQAHALSRP